MTLSVYIVFEDDVWDSLFGGAFEAMTIIYSIGD